MKSWLQFKVEVHILSKISIEMTDFESVHLIDNQNILIFYFPKEAIWWFHYHNN